MNTDKMSFVEIISEVYQSTYFLVYLQLGNIL